MCSQGPWFSIKATFGFVTTLGLMVTSGVESTMCTSHNKF